MARMYNTPPQREYEAKPIGGVLTVRQGAYIAAGAAVGLLLGSPLGGGMNLHTLVVRGLIVALLGGMAAAVALARLGEMPLDRYVWLLWRRKSEVSRYPWAKGTAEKPSAQEFLGIREIRDGIIYRTDGTLCLVMEVGGLNYFLLSAAEQDMVDAGIARLLKPLGRPLTIYVQTRYLDAAEALAHYRQATLDFPAGGVTLPDYTRDLRMHMESTLRHASILVRRYYFVFQATGDSARDELAARAAEMAAQLQRVRKIPVRVLNTDQAAEMIHVANNKERSRLLRAPEAAGLGYFDLSVKAGKGGGNNAMAQTGAS